MSSFVNLNDFFMCGRRVQFSLNNWVHPNCGNPSLLDGSHMVGWIVGGPL